MAGRGVSEAEVETVLRSYGTEVPARYGGRHAFEVLGSRKVRVTYKQVDTEEKLVWTVAIDSKGK
jgi:hypothetical protein